MSNIINSNDFKSDLSNEQIIPVELVNEIASVVDKFIVCSPETRDAITLWVIMTWFIDNIYVAPLAVITAPEKRCGKSRLLALMSRLVKNPIVASNITASAVFRTIDACNPTLLIDEGDTFISGREELRGILNCGHSRDTAFVVRLVGKEHEPKKFNVWGAKVIACIGDLPDTIMDRAIALRLHRKPVNQKLSRLKDGELEFERLRAKICRFANDYSNKLNEVEPTHVDGLNDREQDNWDPLLSIAKLVSEDWEKRAIDAALALSRDFSTEQSPTMELLCDLREIFKSIDRISSEKLISLLCTDKEKRWASYNAGKNITPRQIVSLLEKFSIRSKSIRDGKVFYKGYEKNSFIDIFERYLPKLSNCVT